eukprot:364089-Chlamydomonas_euryale.AAC.10
MIGGECHTSHASSTASTMRVMPSACRTMRHGHGGRHAPYDHCKQVKVSTCMPLWLAFTAFIHQVCIGRMLMSTVQKCARPLMDCDCTM